MLTQDQVLDAVKHRKSQTIDGRDYSRLVGFFPVDRWGEFGFKPKEDVEVPPPIPWSEAEILKQLKSDTAFAFEKSLNKRGISAGSMNAVLLMWMWVLEDGLQHHDDYAQYGLPLCKAVAVKFGFPNPIGDKVGNEPEFAEDYYEDD